MLIIKRPKNLHFDFIKEPTKMTYVTPILSRVREVIESGQKGGPRNSYWKTEKQFIYFNVRY